MSVPYTHTYAFSCGTYGIEDYRDGNAQSKHFMADRPHKRFKAWCDGGCIGEASSIKQAKALVFEHARLQLEESKEKACITIAKVTSDLSRLDVIESE